MKRIRHILAIVVIILAIGAYWSYRQALVAVEAAEYQPIAPVLSPIPAGTTIRVVLSNGITEGTTVGDTITGFIAAPVVVRNIPVLPPGIQVEGVVQSIEKGTETAKVRLRFEQVIFDGKNSPLDAAPVETTTRITTDMNTLADGIDTLASAGVGLAIGAASQDSRAVASGLASGAQNGVPAPTDQNTQVTLILTRELRVRT